MTTADKTKKRRGPRLWAILAIGVLLLIALVLVSWFFVLPGALTNRLVQALEEQGLAAVDLDAVELRTDRIRITGLRWGDAGHVRIESAVMHYSLSTILDRRVDRIVLSDVSIRLATETENRFEGILPAPTGEAAARRRPRVLPDLPFAHLQVRCVRLRDSTSEIAVADLDVRRRAPNAAGRGRLDGTLTARIADARSGGSDAENSESVDRAVELRVKISDAQDRVEGRAELRVGLETDSLALEGSIRVERGGEGTLAELALEGSGRIDFVHRRRRIAGPVEHVALDVRYGTTSEAGLRVATQLRARHDEPLVVSGAVPDTIRGLRFGGAVSGEFRGDAQLDFEGCDLSLPGENDETRLRLRGLTGSLELPVGSASTEHRDLRWTSLRAGKFEFGRGEVRGRIERDGVVDIQTARLETDTDASTKGVVSIRGLRLDPNVDSVETALVLHEIDLQRWLDRIGEDRVRADARVSGVLRTRAKLRPRFRVELLGGHLAATEPGRVRFDEGDATREVLAPYVEQIAARVSPGHEELVKQRIFGSLRDFAFDILRLDVVAEDAAPMLAVHVKGKGREVPQELDVHVNVRGVQELLDLALDLNEAVERTREKVEKRRGEGK